MMRYAQDPRSMASYFPTNVKIGLRGKITNLPQRTYNSIKNRYPKKVVATFIYTKSPDSPDSILWLNGERAPKDKYYAGQDAAITETVKWYERLRLRRGKGGETLLKTSDRGCNEELYKGAKKFKKLAQKLLPPKAAFVYKFKLEENGTYREYTFYGLTRELHADHEKILPFKLNEKEISSIEFVTKEEFKQKLIKQMEQSIPKYPPGARADVEWIIDRIVNLNLNFGPFDIPLKDVKRKKVKGVYPIPISENLDPMVRLIPQLYRN